MNKKIIYSILISAAIILGILSVILIADKSQIKEESADSELPVINLNEPFSIKINQTVRIENMDLTLSDISISICPSGAMCIAADHISIELEITKDNSAKIYLNTFGDNMQKEAMGYNILFAGIKPNPLETKELLDLSDYTVILNIQKA